MPNKAVHNAQPSPAGKSAIKSSSKAVKSVNVKPLNTRVSASPEPVDPRANFQLNIGNNIFDVALPDSSKSSPVKPSPQPRQEELDPIAQALAELKGVTKQSSLRVSADRYHGLVTPAPTPGMSNGPAGAVPTPFATANAIQRGTPPPSYDQPVSRLGAPEPAFTAKAMQQTKQKYLDQKNNMFGTSTRASPATRPTHALETRSTNQVTRVDSYVNGQDRTRQVTQRSISPRPDSFRENIAPSGHDSPNRQYDQYYLSQESRQDAKSHSQNQNSYQMQNAQQQQPQQGHQLHDPQQQQRARSPNPYGERNPYGDPNRPRTQSNSPVKSVASSYGHYGSRGSSPGSASVPRAVSPQPDYRQERPNSSRGSDLALQLAPSPQAAVQARPSSSYYGGAASERGGYGARSSGSVSPGAPRVRSQSVAEQRQYTQDGLPILHYGEWFGFFG